MKKSILATCLAVLLIATLSLSGGPVQATELTDAVEDAGDLSKVESLIKNGADINETDGWGFTPLHIAANEGNTKIVQLLLVKGANVKIKDGLNNAGPLFGAVENDSNIEIVKLLLNAGADINEKNVLGITPLHLAAQEGSMKIVELLITKGADVNAKNNDGKTPAMLAKTDEIKKLLTK